jgi:hypothetical protein
MLPMAKHGSKDWAVFVTEKQADVFSQSPTS